MKVVASLLVAPRNEKGFLLSEKPKRERSDEELLKLYLKDIAQYPSLSQVEAADLADFVQAGKAAETQLALLAEGEVDPTVQSDLQERIRVGVESQKSLVQSTLILAMEVAKQYDVPTWPLLDVVQEGNLGLLHAVERYKSNDASTFNDYATSWIRAAIDQAIERGDPKAETNSK